MQPSLYLAEWFYLICLPNQPNILSAIVPLSSFYLNWLHFRQSGAALCSQLLPRAARSDLNSTRIKIKYFIFGVLALSQLKSFIENQIIPTIVSFSGRDRALGDLDDQNQQIWC